MSFDFHTTYNSMSNVELLKILLQKELYQAAAIEAAEKILASRNVSEEEKAMAENDVLGKKAEVQRRAYKKEVIRNDADRFIRNILFPEKRTPAYFIRFFSVVYFILWLISLVQDFRQYVFYWNYSVGMALFDAITRAAMLLMLFWLYRLNKKGWFLLMLNFTFIVVFAGWSFINLNNLGNRFFPGPDTSGLVVELLISGLVLYFFNRKDVLTTLQISRKFQMQTFLFAAALIITYIILNIEGNWSYYFS
jgi:hypothetical protein